ncbi:hypothetical protein WJX77_007306 [Trebouxia sp. C0004]
MVTSLALNWLVGPLLMTGLAWATLPDLRGYRAGVILVGLARCIAMVLIWNQLARGNPEYCAIPVAVNSVMQIVLYAPLALFYLQVVSCQFLGGGQALHIGFWQVCRSVLIFLGAPLVVGIVTRHGFIAWRAGYTYDKAVTQAFTSSSNNFELAIAIAVGMFGINSQEALAAIVGLSDRDSSVVGSSVCCRLAEKEV